MTQSEEKRKSNRTMSEETEKNSTAEKFEKKKAKEQKVKSK